VKLQYEIACVIICMAIMQFTYINLSSEKSWKNYRQMVVLIEQRTRKILKIRQSFQFSVIMVDEDRIHEINREYRNIDRPTDVISFASQDQLSIQVKESTTELGDIFINVKAVREQAEQYGHSLKREFSFLVTHGLLHLLGYDHMKDDDEKEMNQLQEEILSEIAQR